MTLVEQIKQDLISAMKEKDKDKLNTLRSVKAGVQMEVINNKKEENDDLVLDVVNKQIKMRNDSIEEFKKANRNDLVDSYQKEIDILKAYMPEMLSAEELESIIKNAIEETGATTVKEMSLVMKTITPVIKNRCDMKEVSSRIKDLLN
ncbi:MAG: GatB/YqeY domain-containing protein [Bacilli bacterium]|nr:GatB/YqeY domain-containing protein [Bacilli bacterium]